ncbi:MAG: hypothetical protein IKH81_01435 [Clostridia bacterium]|nr:hypothetical protein [Clostridia bacterium]MBR2663974.1 hypothetical protein [Clostridia bacterium]MBR6965734.1 hypothetical protein [Clostridia bacterium]
MKKFTALALSLIMILCAVCAFAEDTGKTEMGTLKVGEAFSIQSRMPEGYTYMPVKATELNMVGILSAGAGRPVVTISIAYNEEYADTERFNDVDEAVVEEIRESFREADPEVVFEDLETAYGTRLLKVAGDGFVDIYTVYKGYELEFVMSGSTIEAADVQMLVDFISDMDFVGVE